MKIEQFDIDRIIGITICNETRTSHRWLPRKQKKWFFGLFKRNAWYEEGWYSNGHYQECYESGCWDATPCSKDSLISYGYLVKPDSTVWHRPYATVYLESDYQVRKDFGNLESAIQWVEELKATSKKTFEIVTK